MAFHPQEDVARSSFGFVSVNLPAWVDPTYEYDILDTAEPKYIKGIMCAEATIDHNGIKQKVLGHCEFECPLSRRELVLIIILFSNRTKIIPTLSPSPLINEITPVISELAAGLRIPTSIDAITDRCSEGRYSINEDKVTTLALYAKDPTAAAWGRFLKNAPSRQLVGPFMDHTIFEAQNDFLGLASEFSHLMQKWWFCATRWQSHREAIERAWSVSADRRAGKSCVQADRARHAVLELGFEVAWREIPDKDWDSLEDSLQGGESD
ncbi:hypothetical protein F5Y19DRAFT_480774 [Xylariaceae sp. FL1651]|nr:hypothetical protein F5Y19DRAFT_480774 [Xylariaceae sp. FL1651]